MILQAPTLHGTRAITNVSSLETRTGVSRLTSLTEPDEQYIHYTIHRDEDERYERQGDVRCMYGTGRGRTYEDRRMTADRELEDVRDEDEGPCRVITVQSDRQERVYSNKAICSLGG